MPEGNDYSQLRDEHKKEGAESYGQTPGGATLNSIRVAQWMSASVSSATAFVGCIGDDDEGNDLERQMEEAGVATAFLKLPEEATGTCVVMVMGSGERESERSLVANLAAAEMYKYDHFQTPGVQKLVERAGIVYAAGYFLSHRYGPKVLIEAGKRMVATGRIMAINMSAPFIVQFFATALDQVLYYSSFVFCNETEMQDYGISHDWGEDVAASALKLSGMPHADRLRPRVVIVTQGKDPTLVKHTYSAIFWNAHAQIMGNQENTRCLFKRTSTPAYIC